TASLASMGPVLWERPTAAAPETPALAKAAVAATTTGTATLAAAATTTGTAGAAAAATTTGTAGTAGPAAAATTTGTAGTATPASRRRGARGLLVLVRRPGISTRSGVALPLSRVTRARSLANATAPVPSCFLPGR